MVKGLRQESGIVVEQNYPRLAGIIQVKKRLVPVQRVKAASSG
jgi:hypothetical protein